MDAACKDDMGPVTQVVQAITYGHATLRGEVQGELTVLRFSRSPLCSRP